MWNPLVPCENETEGCEEASREFSLHAKHNVQENKVIFPLKWTDSKQLINLSEHNFFLVIYK
jgi:hypothetical protein